MLLCICIFFHKINIWVASFCQTGPHLLQKKGTLSHYDAAAVKNAAVFKMLISTTEMHSSEPIASCSQQRCITAAQCFSSPRLRTSRLMFPSAGWRPSDRGGVLSYLNFQHCVKWKYALRHWPWPWRSGPIGPVMLMQGYGILLAFEVWPSPLHEGAFHSQLKTGCVLRPFCALQEEYLLSGLHARGPNELWCCANSAS